MMTKGSTQYGKGRQTKEETNKTENNEWMRGKERTPIKEKKWKTKKKSNPRGNPFRAGRTGSPIGSRSILVHNSFKVAYQVLLLSPNLPIHLETICFPSLNWIPT
jgi:hypothetical protein